VTTKAVLLVGGMAENTTGSPSSITNSEKKKQLQLQLQHAKMHAKMQGTLVDLITI
jgi:hypothetical protein